MHVVPLASSTVFKRTKTGPFAAGMPSCMDTRSKSPLYKALTSSFRTFVCTRKVIVTIEGSSAATFDSQATFKRRCCASLLRLFNLICHVCPSRSISKALFILFAVQYTHIQYKYISVYTTSISYTYSALLLCIMCMILRNHRNKYLAISYELCVVRMQTTVIKCTP